MKQNADEMAKDECKNIENIEYLETKLPTRNKKMLELTWLNVTRNLTEKKRKLEWNTEI